MIDRLSIAEEFSRTPGPRTKEEGPCSAELFWEKVHLQDRFARALETDGQLLIDLDGVAGYGTSFLDQTFGGLARMFGTDKVLKHLDIKCEEDSFVLEEAWNYVRDPKPPRLK